ncbi:hypothetical protein [Draconibacterium mangrovi]|uniref:hypothetical protein n=1 Tax=Draconibacterium mangrovi TaxID=2697469 RepID=UPI0013D44CD4|nr:hypothetical protein [Draconibacterium mangrovi]
MSNKSNRNIIAAIILAIGLITSSVIYAYSTRYEVIESGFAIVDKWTGIIRPVDTE